MSIECQPALFSLDAVSDASELVLHSIIFNPITHSVPFSSIPFHSILCQAPFVLISVPRNLTSLPLRRLFLWHDRSLRSWEMAAHTLGARTSPPVELSSGSEWTWMSFFTTGPCPPQSKNEAVPFFSSFFKLHRHLFFWAPERTPLPREHQHQTCMSLGTCT